jgi:hypothetical protein
MPTDKATIQAQSENPLFAGIEWWKPQAAALQTLYRESLTFTEARLRKQADFLQQLAGAENFPEVLKAQTSFAQEFCADSSKGALKAFSVLRKTVVPNLEAA